MSIELSEFYQTFFDEASEHLDTMESLLLELNVEAPDLDHLNAIFRSAHSIKGGSGMFGFNDMTEVTHILETLLDRLRKNELPLREEMVDAFLQATDVLKALLAARQGAAPVDEAVVKDICATLQRLSEDKPQSSAQSASGDGETAKASAAAEVYDLRFSREGNPLSEPAPFDFLVDTLKGIGKLEIIDQGSNAHLRITQPKSLDDVREAFAFFIQPEQYQITRVEPAGRPPAPVATTAPASPPPAKATEVNEDEQGYGFFVDITQQPKPPAQTPSETPPSAKSSEPVSATKKTETAKPPQASAPTDTSIRVNIEKVDQLINLAGELVITQAMLKQTASQIDPVLHERLHEGIALLERNTRDLQEAVMSIRMIPMSFVFSRFPRMVRDLSAKMGKKVNFKTIGEGTELDKGLIEKITDPLTHLVRNSLDHGIEPPDVRVAKGKEPEGNLILRAFHQGGNVVIEVRDDGAGLNREKILAKARERGMNVSDNMPDQEVWQLIMAPGFSTAEVITDVSGRGVGMDVVKKNIESLNGRIEIESYPGAGTTMTIRLPLTLAILDGLSIDVGGETFIIPLTSIIESLQPKPEDIKTIAGQGRVVHVRGEYLPLVPLYQVFDIRPRTRKPEKGTLMIVEADGIRAALWVDELLGQHQVVIKSLETNYRKVPCISGATIMGDGRVALILDVNALVRLSKTATLGEIDLDDEEEDDGLGEEENVAVAVVGVSPQTQTKHATTVSQPEVTIEAEDLGVDLDGAIAAHQAWKTRLRRLLDGQSEEKLDYRIVCQDNQCPLGKWIYGKGMQHARLSEFKSLKEAHADFHKVAGEVVRNYQTGEKKVAEALMAIGGKFTEASTKTVGAIRALQKALARQDAQEEALTSMAEEDSEQVIDRLEKAVDAHQKWKTRLRKLLDGQSEEKLDHRIVCQDNQCDLGKWIYGPGARHARMNEYVALKAQHAEFHKIAGEIVRRYQQGDKRGAESLLAPGGAFIKASTQTISAIKALERAIG